MLTVQKASFDPSDDAAALRAARYSLGLDGAPQAVNPDADGHGGIWLGSQEALAQLGLERGAEVGERELAHALQGRHAQTGAQVRRPGTKKVRRADGEEVSEQRVNSFRLAFSAPKSVSVVWSQAGPELRAQIERVMLESAHASIDHFVRTREVISGTAVGRDFAASFSVHKLARTAEGEALPSPQLHVHVDLVGVTGEDGRLRTPNSQAFYQDNAMREAGALGRARLARRLDGLGFRIETQTGNGGRYFEIAGVPAALCERMSGRSRDVAAHIQGLKDATGQTPSARAAAAAALATRRAKVPFDLERAEALWRAHGQELEFTMDDARRDEGGPSPRRRPGVAEAELRKRLLARLWDEGPTVTLGQIRSMAYELAPVDLPDDEVATVLRDMQDEGELIALDRWQVTSREIRAGERHVQRVARAAAARGGGALSRASVAAGVAVAEEGLGGHRLDPEQAAAVAALTNGAGWTVLTGRAGTGKGPVLEAVAEAHRREGWTIVGTAIDGATTQRVGHQLGAEAATIRQVLNRYAKGYLRIDARTLIVIDEASKVGLRDWDELALIVEATGAHLMGVGDVGQIGAIESPGMLDVMIADGSGIPVAVLRTVRRHRDPDDPSRDHPWLVDYQTALYAGDAHEAIRILRREDAMTMHATRDDAMVGLVDTWERRRTDHAIAAEDAVLIVYGSNADVDTVNELAQDRRLKAGEIAGAGVRAVDRRYALHAGDVVMMRGAAFDPRYKVAGVSEKRVENGTMGVVVAVDEARDLLRVQFEDPAQGHRVVTIDQARMRAEHAQAKPGEQAPALRLAYAGHPFPMQGATFKYVGSLWGGVGQDKESTYSGDTRVKYWLDVHFDRESGGRDGTDDDRFQRMGETLSVPRHKLASITWEQRPDVEIAQEPQAEAELPLPASREGREAARERRLREAARREARERVDPLAPYAEGLGPVRAARLAAAAEELMDGLGPVVDERGEAWLDQLLARHERVAERFAQRNGEVREAGFVARESEGARERAEDAAEAAMGFEEQAADARGFGRRAERADAEQAAEVQQGIVAKETGRAADLELEAADRLALSGDRLDRWLGEHGDAAARWLALSHERAARDELGLLRDLRSGLERPPEELVERVGPQPPRGAPQRGEWQEVAGYAERRRLEAQRAAGAPRDRFPRPSPVDPAMESRIEQLRGAPEVGPQVAPEVNLDAGGLGL